MYAASVAGCKLLQQKYWRPLAVEAYLMTKKIINSTFNSNNGERTKEEVTVIKLRKQIDIKPKQLNKTSFSHQLGIITRKHTT